MHAAIIAATIWNANRGKNVEPIDPGKFILVSRKEYAQQELSAAFKVLQALGKTKKQLKRENAKKAVQELSRDRSRKIGRKARSSERAVSVRTREGDKKARRVR